MNSKMIVGQLGILGVAILTLALCGCASVLKGTSQTVTFTSTPDGAEVLVDGLSRGVTPLSISLKKNQYSTVMVKKAGYATISRPLDKKYDGIALLNVVWDSSTTDLITGAVYEYEPGSYNFSLARAQIDENNEVETPAATVSKKAAKKAK